MPCAPCAVAPDPSTTASSVPYRHVFLIFKYASFAQEMFAHRAACLLPSSEIQSSASAQPAASAVSPQFVFIRWPRTCLPPHAPTAAGTASSRREKGPLLQALPPLPTPTPTPHALVQVCSRRQSRMPRGSLEAGWQISWQAVARNKKEASAPFQRQPPGSLGQETSMVREQFGPFESW